jgi:hypothetical protein
VLKILWRSGWYKTNSGMRQGNFLAPISFNAMMDGTVIKLGNGTKDQT